MREIKFRGKTKMSSEELEGFEHDNGWFYGNLVMYGKTPYIVGDFIEVDQEYTINEFWVPVYPESVGQYTGLNDKNGKEIYEGDIVSTDLSRPFLIVEYRNGAFMYQCHHNGQDYYDRMEPPYEDEKEFTKYHEIIGNTYEQPHLLGGESDE